MNKVYSSSFNSDMLASRTCNGANGLAAGALVIIDCDAAAWKNISNFEY